VWYKGPFGSAVPIPPSPFRLPLPTPVPLHIDDERHAPDVIRLNEAWIKQYFNVEEADRQFFADPWKVVRDGGHILSLVEDDRVVGVCALVRESAAQFQLARMAVDAGQRGRGYGDALLRAAIELARQGGAQTITLLSNTVLQPAITLYRKHGFETVSECPHPVYARCNITMELRL
jgi:putative acetyltransferase